jgi:hypothetical protein
MGRLRPLRVHLDSLLPPPIDGDLQSLLEEAGAELDADGCVLTFGNDSVALAALPFGLVAFDRSHCSRLRVAGTERVAALQPLCGHAELAAVPPGQSIACRLMLPPDEPLCLVVAHESSHLVLLPSSGVAERITEALPSLVVEDVSASTAQFVLLGPGVEDALRQLRCGGFSSAAEGAHRVFGFQGAPVLLLAATGNAGNSRGVTLVTDESVAGALWATLTGPVGALPAGDNVWRRL